MIRLFKIVFVFVLAAGTGSLAQQKDQNTFKADEPTQKGKQGQGSQQAGAVQPSKEESQAFQEIQSELDADKQIQLVNDFEKKFPESRGLPIAYLMAAQAYQQKGDIEHVLEYGEKSIKLYSDNPVALLLVASMLPEPQALKGNGVDKEKKLTEAEEYANKALKLVEQLPKQPNMTDEQFQKSKAQLVSWGHSSLGMVHLQRSAGGLAGPDADELAKAEKEYQMAVSSTERPNPGDYFRLGEALRTEGKISEAIDAFSKAAQFDQSGAIKNLADKVIEDLKKKSSPEKPPAKP